jgi:hypothetical protein
LRRSRIVANALTSWQSTSIGSRSGDEQVVDGGEQFEACGGGFDAAEDMASSSASSNASVRQRDAVPAARSSQSEKGVMGTEKVRSDRSAL